MERRRKIVGQRIRQAREEKGLKQKDLAARVSVEPQTVSNWERGVYEPDLDTLDVVARALGRTTAYLLGGDEPTQPDAAGGLEERLDRVEDMLAEVLRRLPGGSESSSGA